MFIKNYNNCINCIHTSVCQYKFILKEASDKIEGCWDNLVTPDIFKLELECTEFKKAETMIKNDSYAWSSELPTKRGW